MHQGSCLCGAVRFTVSGTLSDPAACHCSQCRRQSGHYWASADAPNAAVAITGGDKVTWYQASDAARRGFCATCGSFLFWQRIGADNISVAMGALAAPTETRLSTHIFVADKGDYYDIADGLPQHPQER